MTTTITSDTRELGRIIANGGIVVFPTETVFGIGAASTNFHACKRIYTIKNRPMDNPLIAHFFSIDQIRDYCYLDEISQECLVTFSPGPLTLVLRKKNESLFSLDLDTIAVRIPGHREARDLIRQSGVPISAPSANPSGKPSFTRASDVHSFYDGIVDGILLGNAPEIGIESTVIDMTTNTKVILRPGKITETDLRSKFPNVNFQLVNVSNGSVIPETPELANKPNAINEIRSPGMKYRHYSPIAKVVILNQIDFQKTFNSFLSQSSTNKDSLPILQKTAFIGSGFSPREGLDICFSTNEEYMRNLYSFFIDSDKNHIQICYCQSPLEDKYKDSILNRLHKAASKT